MRRAFILRNTRLQRPPQVPELQLYLADEVMPIWRMTEQELGEAGVPPPFWAFAWPGGQAIARYLLDHPEDVAGKRVLDLGAGSGLCAIAAMKAGAASALAADIDELAEEAVALNARANGVSVAFTNRDLLDASPPTEIVGTTGPGTPRRAARSSTGAWTLRGGPYRLAGKDNRFRAAITVLGRGMARRAATRGGPYRPDVTGSRVGADLILAGDLCYEQPMAGRVLAWLRAAHAGGTRVLIGDPGRDYFPREGLIRLATYQVPTTRELEDRDIKQTGVFTLAAPR